MAQQQNTQKITVHLRIYRIDKKTEFDLNHIRDLGVHCELNERRFYEIMHEGKKYKILKKNARRFETSRMNQNLI